MAQRSGDHVVLEFDKFNDFIAEYSDSISLAGMFIPSRDPVDVGTVLDLRVRLKDGFQILKGSGQVVWTRAEADGPDRPAGMGIRFHKLDDSSRTLINKIVYNRLMDGGRPFELGDALSTREDLPGPTEEDAESATATHPLVHPSSLEEPVPSATPAIGGEVKTEEPVPSVAPAIENQEEAEQPVPSVAPPLVSTGDRSSTSQPEVLTSPDEPEPSLLSNESMETVAQELEDSLGLTSETESQEPLPEEETEPEDGDDEGVEFGDDSEISFAIVEGAPEGDADGDADGAAEDQAENREEDEVEGPERSPSEPAFQASDIEASTEALPSIDEPSRKDALWEPPAWSDSPSLGEPPPELPVPEPPQDMAPETPEEQEELSRAPDVVQTALFDPASPAPEPPEESTAATTEGISLSAASLSTPPPPSVSEPQDLDASILSMDRQVLVEEAEQVREEEVARRKKPRPRGGRAQRRPKRLGRVLFPLLVLVVVAGLGHLFFDDILRWAGLGPDSTPPMTLAQATDSPPTPIPTQGQDDPSAGVPLEPPVEEVAVPGDPETSPAPSPGPETQGLEPSPAAESEEPAETVRTTPVAESAPEPVPGVPATLLEDITWSRSAAGLELVLRGNGAFRPDAFTYVKFNGGDPRLLIRLIGITQPYTKSQVQVGAPEAGQIRIGFHQEKRPPELHVVVDLASMSIRVVSVETRGPDIVALLR